MKKSNTNQTFFHLDDAKIMIAHLVMNGVASIWILVVPQYCALRTSFIVILSCVCDKDQPKTINISNPPNAPCAPKEVNINGPSTVDSLAKVISQSMKSNHTYSEK